MPSLARLSIVLALFAVVPIRDQGVAVLGRIVPTSTGGGTSGTTATHTDLTVAGCFVGPNLNSGNWTVTYPAAIKTPSVPRRWIQLAGDGHIYEFNEPTLKSCPPATAMASLNQAALIANGDWGPLPQLRGGDNDGFTPIIDSYSYVYGLHYDQILSSGVGNWTSGYNTIPAGRNTMFSFTFGAYPTLTLTRCWGFANTPMPSTGSGYLDIPSWFQSMYAANLPTNARWAVGLGGVLASLTVGGSLGMSLHAMAPPTSAPCTTNVDNPIGAANFKVLEMHAYGTATPPGPTCDPGSGPGIISGTTINCEPGSGIPSTSVPPQPPTPMKTLHTGYSQNYYIPSWDPYGGFGYYSAGSMHSAAWAEGLTKRVIMVFLSMPSGGLNTTVLASPPPTVSYPNITFSIPVGATFKGPVATQANDLIWVQTCDPALDSDSTLGGPCQDNGNGRNNSWVIVDTYNPSTGAVTAHIAEADYGNGVTGHKPFVGGFVRLGGLYSHANPIPSRADIRVLFIDPTQLGEVAQGTRQVYDVVAVDDVPLSTWMSPFGCPGCATPGVTTYPTRHRPIWAAADNTNHQVIAGFENAIGNAQLFVVFNVP